MDPPTRSKGHTGPGFGCLGSILAFVVLVVLVSAVLVGALVIAGIVVAIAVVGLIALGIDRLMVAFNPNYRRRRVRLESPGEVIDTTATLHESNPKRDPDP